MNYSAIELAIEVLNNELDAHGVSEEERDDLIEHAWGLFGLTINGMIPEEEQQIQESIKELAEGEAFCCAECLHEENDISLERPSELRKAQHLSQFFEWAKDYNLYFIKDEEFEDLYDKYLAEIGS